jgi:hypothetical protein
MSLLKNSFVPLSDPRFGRREPRFRAFRAYFGAIDLPDGDFFNSLVYLRWCPFAGREADRKVVTSAYPRGGLVSMERGFRAGPVRDRWYVEGRIGTDRAPVTQEDEPFAPPLGTA